jgi:arylsulfatase
MARYPKIYNIEADPHEVLNVAAFNGWLGSPYLQVVIQYETSVRNIPTRLRLT